MSWIMYKYSMLHTAPTQKHELLIDDTDEQCLLGMVAYFFSSSHDELSVSPENKTSNIFVPRDPTKICMP